MKTAKYILSLFMALTSTLVWSQAAYVLPSPTGATDSVKLYIDVNSAGGGLKDMLLNHPEYQDSVYIWSWNPAEPVGGNGSWSNSNPNRILKNEGNLLFSLKFVPVSYYGVDGPTFFSKGISCLAKLKNGNAFPDDGVGEAKTPDIHVAIIPKLCDAMYCVFPQQGKVDDYISITYDNNQETNVDLQNLGPDECYLFIRAQQDLFQGVNYTTPVLTSSTPALKMKPVTGQPGIFRLTIIPEELFDGVVPENFDMQMLRFYVLKPGFTYLFNPPFEDYSFSDCSD